MNKTLWAVTIVVEIVGIMVVCAGIGVELAMHAALGYILVTVGAVILATGGAVYAKFLRGR